ncbi:MAG: hypothetical protein FWC46_05140 [Actinomycetia bacterium]|nr:hypothetical protein [Actinomycetes bacterium]
MAGSGRGPARVARRLVATVAVSLVLGVATTGSLVTWGGFTLSTPGAADGRPSGIRLDVTNRSDTSSITLVSAGLTGADGLELVDAYTLDEAAALPMSTWIPPRAEEWGDPAQPGMPDFVANWAGRVPLSGAVLAPGETRQVILVLAAAPADNCPYTEGFAFRYREDGRTYTVHSDAAVMIPSPAAGDGGCTAALDRIAADRGNRWPDRWAAWWQSVEEALTWNSGGAPALVSTAPLPSEGG